MSMKAAMPATQYEGSVQVSRQVDLFRETLSSLLIVGTIG